MIGMTMRSGMASFSPSATLAGEAQPRAGKADQGAGLGARHLGQHGRDVADRLVDHHAGRTERLDQLGAKMVRVDLARDAGLGGELGRLLATRHALRRDLLHARRRPRLEAGIGPGLQHGEQVGIEAAAVALQAQVRREGPHRDRPLLRVDIDMRPPGRGILRHVLGDPRHIDIDQQADIGVGQRLGRHEAAMAGRIVRQVEMNGTEFDDADAGELRQLVEQRDRGVDCGPNRP